MERYALNLKKRNFFSEKYATVPSRWRFGVKNRSFVRFSPGKGVPKTIFCPWWPRLLHNLGLMVLKILKTSGAIRQADYRVVGNFGGV
jgi:hypothetical protein